MLALFIALCSAPLAFADAPPQAVDKAAADMAASAKKFLASLTPAQRETASFEFKDPERMNWHFIPKPRKGLTLKDMSEEQRGLAKALLAGAISQSANTKVLAIMSLEDVLKELEAGKGGPKRDPEMYYWSLFGEVGGAKPWGWRMEGHHMSVNFTVVSDKAVASAPFFLGTNPAEVKEGPKKGLRVLAEEEDMGRAFVKALDAEQMKKAVIMQAAPKEVVTAAERQAVLTKFEGVPYGALKDAQKAALVELIGLYANRLRPELAANDMQRITKAGLDKVYFGWAGGTEKGEPHYYRIHGPTFLVEYDDTQNNANHIHTVWRDLENDFGGDLLRKHYEADHK
jgi:hypothetical protein